MSAAPTFSRTDPEGRLHDAELTLCASCGCVQYRALDMSGLVWDAGPEPARGCGDRSCSCHTAPRYGERRIPAD